MIRYISPATLEEFGISTFDRFASVFCGVEVAQEQDAAGRFRMIQRFAKYCNVIELSKMFRSVADVEQRKGRIVRQGNILEEVEIIRYGIE